MRKLASLLVPLALVAALGACKPGVAMWSSCVGTTDKTATDSTYVLVCKDGTWQPIMTVDEFVRIRKGEAVTIAPLPTRPTTTTTTTSTTAPTSSTTAAPTTTSSTSTTAAPTTTTTSTTTTTAPVPSPDITGVAPATGSTAGGTTVVLTGTALTGAVLVTFGGIAATSYTVDSDTQITAITAAHTAGAVNIVVNTGVGGTTEINAYTYV